MQAVDDDRRRLAEQLSAAQADQHRAMSERVAQLEQQLAAKSSESQQQAAGYMNHAVASAQPQLVCRWLLPRQLACRTYVGVTIMTGSPPSWSLQAGHMSSCRAREWAAQSAFEQ